MRKTQSGIRLTRVHIASIALAVLAVSAVGALLYWMDEQETVRQSSNQIGSIGKLKVQQVSAWYAERLSDARFVFNSAHIAEETEALIRNTRTQPGRERSPAWMQSMYRNNHYVSMRLLSPDGRVIMAIPESARHRPSVSLRQIDSAASCRCVVVADLSRRPTGNIRMDIIIPVFRRGGDSALVGLSVMTIDPSRELFGILESWPIPTHTAECLLVRREADSVLFLNRLRFRPDAALRLRFPADDEDLPGSKAVRGMTGVVTGIDYRGIAVYASLHAVPGTPWYLVAKTDQSELFGRLHRDAEYLFLLVLAISIGIAAVVRALVAQQQIAFYIRENSERRRAEQHIAGLNRTLSMLSNINQLIMRSRDLDELYSEACRIGVEDGAFAFVWIGFVDESGTRIRSAAVSGVLPVFKEGLAVSALDEPEGRGPTGTAVREQRVDVCNDVFNDPRMAPWIDRILALGAHSAASFPLFRGERAIGAMTYYSTQQDFFDEDEITLLTQLAVNVSHAIAFQDAERQRAEAAQKLWREHDLLIRVMETSPFGITMRDTAGSYRYVNARAEAILNLSRGQHGTEDNDGMMERLLQSDGRPVDVAQLPIHRILRGETVVRDARFLVATASGARALISVTSAPVHDASGEIDGVVSLYEDITERERTEEGLREMQTERDALIRRLQLQFDRLPLAFMLLDRETRILDANPRAEQIFGYQKEEIVGHSLFHRLISEGSRAVMEKFIRELILSEDTMHSVIECATKSGATILCEWHFTPLRNAAGVFIGLMAMAADVTERVRSEHALIESERRFALFMANLPAYAFIKDAVGRKVFANSMLALDSPAADDESGARAPSALLPSELSDTLSAHDRVVLHSGEPAIVEELRTETQQQRTFLVYKFPIPQSDGSSLLGGIALDITERKDAEEAARLTSDQLRLMAKRLSEVEEIERKHIAEELHDDVGQNLTAIIINLNLVLSLLKPEERARVGLRLEDSLALVESTVERTRTIMASLRPAMLDDYGVLTAVRWFAGTLQKRFGVEIIVSGTEAVPRLSQTMETVLFRISQEALHNVIKHADARQVHVDFESDPEHCALTITDDGKGFDASLVEKRAERRGWGLMTMKERAEAIGGTFTIESREPGGTRVTIEFTR